MKLLIYPGTPFVVLLLQTRNSSAVALLQEGNPTYSKAGYWMKYCLNVFGMQDGTTTPGLDTQVGGSCTNACTSLYNTPGAALSDGVGSICMATDEQGTTNHFGTTKDGSCNYVSGLSSTSVTSNAFSCVCSFAQALKTAG